MLYVRSLRFVLQRLCCVSDSSKYWRKSHSSRSFIYSFEYVFVWIWDLANYDCATFTYSNNRRLKCIS